MKRHLRQVKKYIEEYGDEYKFRVVYLEKAQLITILRDNSFGISSLGKVEKIYLNNTNLSYALVGDIKDSYLVKDDVEYGSANIVPLWTFGLLY